MSESLAVVNNEAERRFEVTLGDEVAFTEYRLRDGVLVLPHTVVPEAFAGRGDWGMAQGVSQAEHFGECVHYFRPDGSRVAGVDRIQDGSGAKAPADAPEEEGEDDHQHGRLQNGPGHAEDRLLVAHLHVAPGEEVNQFAEAPEFVDVDQMPAVGRADDRDGPVVRGARSGGVGDGSGFGLDERLFRTFNLRKTHAEFPRENG